MSLLYTSNRHSKGRQRGSTARGDRDSLLNNPCSSLSSGCKALQLAIHHWAEVILQECQAGESGSSLLENPCRGLSAVRKSLPSFNVSMREAWPALPRRLGTVAFRIAFSELHKDRLCHTAPPDCKLDGYELTLPIVTAFSGTIHPVPIQYQPFYKRRSYLPLNP